MFFLVCCSGIPGSAWYDIFYFGIFINEFYLDEENNNASTSNDFHIIDSEEIESLQHAITLDDNHSGEQTLVNRNRKKLN